MENSGENRNCDIIESFSRLARAMRRGGEGGKPKMRGGRRILGVVLQNDGLRTTDLAEKLDIRPSSVTDALKRLEESGLIRREKDKDDSRIIRVYATENAREAYEEREAERKQQGQMLAKHLTPEEQAEFCRICEKLSAVLEEQHPR